MWGSDPRFSIGAIKNADLARLHFPDWTCIFYHDDSVTSEHIHELSTRTNVELINIDKELSDLKKVFGMFWRYMPLFERDGIFLVRDTDSRLTARESKAVAEWEQSDRIFHAIRDHDSHYEWPIMGGLFGIRGQMNPYYYDRLRNYWLANFYTLDQIFLAREIWPIVGQSVKFHGIREAGWFGPERSKVGYNFVGQGWYEDDTPIYSFTAPSTKYQKGQITNAYNSSL